MEPSYVTESVFNEVTKRIDDENHRQNERIAHLEKNFELINNLYISVERLASNMETMAKELSRQGDCLKELEMKPGKRWDAVIGAIISGIIGLAIGYLSTH